MTRLHFVRRARKARRKYGIKKGSSYFWWRFARGVTQYSLTMPPRSAYATRNPDLGTLMDCEDEFNELSADDGPETLSADLESLAESVNDVAESVGEKLDNLRGRGVNSGDTHDLLENRMTAARDIADALRSAAAKAITAPDDDRNEYLAAVLDEVTWEYE